MFYFMFYLGFFASANRSTLTFGLKVLFRHIQNSAEILKIVQHRRKSSLSNLVYQSITLTTRTVADGHAKCS